LIGVGVYVVVYVVAGIAVRDVIVVVYYAGIGIGPTVDVVVVGVVTRVIGGNVVNVRVVSVVFVVYVVVVWCCRW